MYKCISQSYAIPIVIFEVLSDHVMILKDIDLLLQGVGNNEAVQYQA